MKKTTLIGAVVGALAGFAVLSFAGMEDPTVVNDKSLANAAAYTNSTFIRGTFRGVFVKIEDAASAVRTNAVSVTSDDGQTLFSANVVGVCTSFYPVMTAMYGTDGAIINASALSSATTNRVYAGAPVASKVTTVVTGVAFPTLTNSVTVRLLFDTK
jgi:hypothetical protein